MAAKQESFWDNIIPWRSPTLTFEEGELGLSENILNEIDVAEVEEGHYRIESAAEFQEEIYKRGLEIDEGAQEVFNKYGVNKDRRLKMAKGAAIGTGLLATGGAARELIKQPSGSSKKRAAGPVTAQDPAEESPPTEQSTPMEERTHEPVSKATEREQNIQEGIPLDGLGAYTDQMLEAEPVQENTAQEISNLLEENNSPREEADALSQILTQHNFKTQMAEYHRQKATNENENIEDTVVVNENYGFFQDSGPILEIYTVQNGQLQSGPILSHTSYGQTSTQSPGDGENPQYLHDMRDSDMWTSRVTQDYQSVQEGIERGIEINDATEEEVREYRADELAEWSRVMFGVDDEPNIRPLDVDTADMVFEAMYGDGDAQIIADLSNEYHSEDFDPDTLVEVEYDGGWNFHTPDDTEMGDPLEGEEKRFS